MIGEHYCWWLLMTACVVWYTTITVYVAIRGAGDIKSMLQRLGDIAQENTLDHNKERKEP